MDNKTKVTIMDMTDRLMKSYGFFCLINEGKQISVIVDDQTSVSMLTDYLVAHPHIFSQVLAHIEDSRAKLN